MSIVAVGSPRSVVDTFNYTDSRVAQINLPGPTPLPPTQTAACLRIQNLFGRINPSYLPTPLVLMLKLSWEASKQLVWIVVTGDNSCRKQKLGLVPFRLLLFRLLPFSPTYYRSVPFRLLMQNVYKHIILTLLMPLIETIVVSHCFGHILQ